MSSTVFWNSRFLIFLHAVLVILLSCLIPAFEPFAPGKIRSSALMFAGIILFCTAFHLITRLRSTINFGIEKSVDLAVYISLWVAENILSIKTSFPEISNRYYPNLTELFPWIGVLGILILSMIWFKDNLSVLQRGWLVLFMLTTFPFTRPLDHHILAMSLPLMAALYTLHRDSSTTARIFSHRRLRGFLLLPAVILLLHSIAAFGRDFDAVIPEILFWLTTLLTVVLTIGMVMLDMRAALRLIKQSIACHVLLLASFALARMIWIASRWDLWSVFTYRLWISLIHPNALATYLAVSFFLLEPWCRHPRSCSFYRVTALTSAVMLLLTQSRGMLFSFAIIFALVWLHLKRDRVISIRKNGKALLMISALVAVTAIIFRRVSYRLIDTGMMKDRLELWKTGLSGLSDHLLSGCGLGSKVRLARFVTDPASPTIDFLRLWLNWDKLGRHFHNIFLEAGWVFGITALLIPLILLLTFLRHRHPLSSGWNSALLVILIGGIADCPFYYPALMTIAASTTGLYLVSSRARRSGTKPYIPMNSMKSVGVTVCIAVLLIYAVFLIPVIHQHATGAVAIYWSGLDPARAEILFRNAAEGYFPALKAVDNLTIMLMRQNRCDEAASVLNVLLRGETQTARPMFRTKAWLETDPLKRTETLFDAWVGDPCGLLGPSVYPEWLLSRRFDPISEIGESFKTSIILDPHFPAQLRRFGESGSDGIRLNAERLKELLQSRGVMLEGCQLDYPDLVLPMTDILSAVEEKLSQDVFTDVDVRDWERRQYLLALINNHDLFRAARLVNTWNLKIWNSMDGTDIDTFRSGPSDYSIIQADRAIRLEDYESAARFLEAVSGTELVDAEWYYLMSLVKNSRGEWAAALEAIEKALEYAPDDIRYQSVKGIALYHTQRKIKALAIFSSILKTSPWMINARVYSGIILYESGRFAEALPHFEIVLDLVPDDPWSYFNLFKCYSSISGKQHEADATLELMRSRFPDDTLPSEIRVQLDSEEQP